MPSSLDHESALFALAVRKPVSERESFMQAVRGSDKPLCQRIETLLKAHDQPENSVPTQAHEARPTIDLDLADAPEPDEAPCAEDGQTTTAPRRCPTAHDSLLR